MVFRLNMRWLVPALAALALSGLLSGCGGSKGSAAPAPTGGLTVTPGSGKVTITWNATPGVEYWLVYGAASSISATPTPTINHVWIQNVSSPLVVAGLANGVTYSFAMNGRIDGGPGGASTASVSAVPRPAGASWIRDTATAGAQMASTDAITGIAYDGVAGFASVSSSGAMYKGQISPGPGISWTAAASPAGTSFHAVAYRNATDGFVAVGAGGYCQGVDLATPTCTTTAGLNWNAVASAGVQTVMVGDGGNILHSDSVGGAWAAGTGASGNLRGVAYVGANWIAINEAGAVFKSADGATWAAATVTGVPGGALRGIASYSSRVVAVGTNGTVMTSADSGLSWTVQTPIEGAPALNAVNLSYDQILVVANGGKVFTSPMVLTPVWTAVPSSATHTTSDLLAVFGSSSLYFSVGSAGTSIYAQ